MNERWSSSDLICTVAAQCRSRHLSNKVWSRLVGTIHKALNDGCEKGVHERSQSAIPKYTNTQKNIFQLSFMLQVHYRVYRLKTDSSSRRGGTYTDEKIVNMRKHVTKQLSKLHKRELLNTSHNIHEAQRSKRWVKHEARTEINVWKYFKKWRQH
jgi:hypothetical protein